MRQLVTTRRTLFLGMTASAARLAPRASIRKLLPSNSRSPAATGASQRGGQRWAAGSGPLAHGAVLAVLLTLVVPGGALRDAVRPRAQAAVAFAGGAVPVPPGAMAGTWPAARAHLCGLASQFRHGDRRAVGAGGRLRVPVPEGRLELRRGNSPRTRPLSMAEEQTEAVKAEVPELNTKLWDAAEAGDAELIRKLVEDGAEVNSAPFVPDEDDDDGDSFSSMPVSELSEEIIASNQASEIDYSSVTADGKIEKPKEETPEEKQKRKKKEKARKKKLAAANKGPSALHLACEKGHSDAVCALVDLGADVNCLTSELTTPLHFAVENGCKDTVQVLVTLGADLKAKNQKGETPVKTGKRVGTDQEVLEFLEEFMGLVEPDGEDAK